MNRGSSPTRIGGRTLLFLVIRNLSVRPGSTLVVFLCIALSVGFLTSTFAFQRMTYHLTLDPDLHTQALLERSGIVLRDEVSMTRFESRRVWLLSISCLLCLVGVTQIQLLNVLQRRREIGILKCLGAADGAVLKMFLLEGLAMGGAGSLAGGVGGLGVSLLQFVWVFEAALLEGSMVGAVLVVTIPWMIVPGPFIAVTASLYPAWRASRLYPAEAIRKVF